MANQVIIELVAKDLTSGVLEAFANIVQASTETSKSKIDELDVSFDGLDTSVSSSVDSLVSNVEQTAKSIDTMANKSSSLKKFGNAIDSMVSSGVSRLGQLTKSFGKVSASAASLPITAITQGASFVGGAFKGAASSALGFAKSLVSVGSVSGGLASGGFGGMLIAGRGLIALTDKQLKAEAQLETVLKRTGNTTGYTKDEIIGYAQELQKATTFGDEATIAASSLIASFKTIKGDEFKRTISLAQDLSIALDRDLSNASRALAMSLNSPERGLRRLRDMGVDFNDEQRAMIRQMMEQGRQTEVQQYLLQELESRYGGTAAAAAEAGGSFEQMKNALGDIGESIGLQLKPHFDSLYKDVIKVAEKFEEWSPIIGQFVGFSLNMFKGFATNVVEFVKDTTQFFKEVWDGAFILLDESLEGASSGFREMFSGAIDMVDVLLGSWRGFRDGIVYLTYQTVYGFQAIWEQVVDFFQVSWIKMQGLAKSAWLAIGQASVKYAMPTFAKLFIWLEKKKKAWKGEKWLLTPEEEERTIRSTQEQFLNKYRKQRQDIERQTNALVLEQRIKHEAKMAQIGQKSLDKLDEWKKKTKDYPRLSATIKDAWEKAAKAQKEFKVELPDFDIGDVFGDLEDETINAEKAQGGFEGLESLYKRIAAGAAARKEERVNEAIEENTRGMLEEQRLATKELQKFNKRRRNEDRFYGLEERFGTETVIR